MMELPIANWAAWAPGLETQEAWLAWDGSETGVVGDGKPDVKFLPAMFRRRLSGLTRMALRAAYDCVGDEGAPSCRSVFASRYGEQTVTLDLLTNIMEEEPISPTKFSVSVHNTASGLFSIAYGNKQPSTALSALENTFQAGLMEAITQFHAHPETPLLYVMVDEPLPGIYEEFQQGAAARYACALLLRQDADLRLQVTRETGTSATSESTLPPALRFLRWLLSAEAGTSLAEGPATWTFRRETAASVSV